MPEDESGRRPPRVARWFRSVPNQRLWRQVEIAGPFDRAMASTGATELCVIGAQGFENRAQQQFSDVPLNAGVIR